MVYSSVGYCKCGHEIWIEYLQNKKAWIMRFSDDQHDELHCCPRCGKVLKDDDLESK